MSGEKQMLEVYKILGLCDRLVVEFANKTVISFHKNECCHEYL